MTISRRWNMRHTVLSLLLILLLEASLSMVTTTSYAQIDDASTTPEPSVTATSVPSITATPEPTATATPEPTATPKPTATPTLPIGERPDHCERNDTREQACPIAIDSVNRPFTFMPPDDQDYYRIDLGAPSGLQTTITVRSSGSLDLLTTITRDDGAVLTTISSPAISTTLAADVAGGVIMRVENRDAHDPSGQTYNIEVRRTLPPPLPMATADSLPPDKLENNWNPVTAAPIGVGVLYDLNFVCPVAWGCAGGDHDYLRLPVKKGGQYLLCTFDLGPGVDTVLELFWSTSDTPIAGNDDARLNTSFLSVLRWVAPADGDVIVRIAPRTGGTNPVVFDEKASTYRFAVALSGSALAMQLEARIAEQTNVPTPTPSLTSPGGNRAAPTAAPAPSAQTTPGTSTAAPVASGPNPSGATMRGQAIVVATETAFRIAPNSTASQIQTLPAEMLVTLTGQFNGLWVSVTTTDSVLPGWVLGTDLRRVNPDQTPVASAVGGIATPTAPQAVGVAPTAAPTAPHAASVSVRPLAPLPIDPPPSLLPRASLTVSVTVIAATDLPRATPSSARTPTPSPVAPRVGVRVQLVNAFGDLLAEAVTGSSGQVALTRELAASEALFVRLPAAGLEVAVDPRQPHITIALPGDNQ